MADKAKAKAPLLSEGVRQDIEIHGKAVDPATGGVFAKDKTGELTYTDRTGIVTKL